MEDIPITQIYTNIPKFTFKSPKDIYDKLLINEPTTYKGEKIVEVKCIKSYYDNELERQTKKNEILKVRQSRAEELINHIKGALVEYV